MAPVEATVIDNWHSCVAGAVEKASLVILMTISQLQVTLLDL